MSTRFDWSPYTSRFTVRMPTSTYDIFTERVVQEVASQLKSVARRDTDIAAVLDLVRSESTSDVYLYGYEAIDDQYPKHTPDASFAQHLPSQTATGSAGNDPAGRGVHWIPTRSPSRNHLSRPGFVRPAR